MQAEADPTHPDLGSRTLNSIRYGQLALELSQALEDCVKAASTTGKMATLTLNLKIKPQAKGAQIFINDELKTKIPEFEREATIFFPEENGNLLREDPRQTSLPGLKAVEDNQPANYKTAQG